MGAFLGLTPGMEAVKWSAWGEVASAPPPAHLPQTTMANRNPSPGAPSGAPLRRMKPSDAPGAPSPDAQPIAEQTPARRPLAAMLTGLALPDKATRTERTCLAWSPDAETAASLSRWGWVLNKKRAACAPHNLDSLDNPIPTPAQAGTHRGWQARYAFLTLIEVSGLGAGEKVHVADVCDAMDSLIQLFPYGRKEKFMRSFEAPGCSILASIARTSGRYAVREGEYIMLMAERC